MSTPSASRRPPLVSHRVLADAVAGDQRAVATVLAKIEPIVRRYCRIRLGRPASFIWSAEDITQEALFGIVSALPRYTGTVDELVSFVLGIARNKVADTIRKLGRDRSVPVENLPEVTDRQQLPEQHVLDSELRQELSALLDGLVPRQRKIVELRVIHGMSCEETAAAVSSTTGAVRVAQHRALATLRRRAEEVS